MLEKYTKFIHNIQKKFKNPYLNITKEEALVIVETKPRALNKFPIDLKRDLELVIKAISKDPWVFGYLEVKIQNKYPVALATVAKDGKYIQKLDEKWQTNKDIVHAALTSNNNVNTMVSISKEFKFDVEDAIVAINAQLDNYRHLNYDLKKNRTVVLHMLENKKASLADLAVWCRSEPEYVYLAVSMDANSIDYSEPSLDKKIRQTKKENNFDTLEQSAKYLLNKFLAEEENKKLHLAKTTENKRIIPKL